MTPRSLLSTALLVLAVMFGAAVFAAGQTKTWTPSKTPWGDPDLQGIYTSDDYMNTPLERPANFGDRRYFTDAELAETAAAIARRAELDARTEQQNVMGRGRAEEARPNNPLVFDGGADRNGWGERPRRPARQTSLIVEPANGRMPPLTPLGKQRLAEVGKRQTALSPQRPPQSWTDFDFYIRCISRGLAGSILPSSYDNGTQIVQAPGFVTILHEKVHEARVIPLDKRPHLGSSIRSYLGDSRGHFEGNTLVVETTNFLDNTTGVGRNGGNAIATSDALRIVERFTRVDADTINYEMTVDDPKLFTRPWKVAYPITQEVGYELFEYTCHETNYTMTNVLRGARVQEKPSETGK